MILESYQWRPSLWFGQICRGRRSSKYVYIRRKGVGKAPQKNRTGQLHQSLVSVKIRCPLETAETDKVQPTVSHCVQDELKSTAAAAATGLPTPNLADTQRLSRRIARLKDISDDTKGEQRLREVLAEEITKDNHPHQGDPGNRFHGLNVSLNSEVTRD